jgi:restriction system protein
MKNYFRIILGKNHVYSDESIKGNFVGVGFIPEMDFTGKLPDEWREFNKKYIPTYLEKNPGASKVKAGLACGALHTASKGMSIGDIVLCPDTNRNYYAGEITGDYFYSKGSNLPHRRNVKWFSKVISRDSMSEALQNSTGSANTLAQITKHASEIESLISGLRPSIITSSDVTIEDPSIFALEKHLEDFLVENWEKTELGKKFNIFKEDDELVGQQYETDTGPIDILAISKDKKELLVVELKKGRASDAVVGQVQRYMGYIKDEIAEDNQEVKGVIIAFENDLKIKRALSVTKNIDFYTYKVDFTLHKKNKDEQ